MTFEERFKAAVAEIQATMTKYNLNLSGCGCCGSPWIEDDGLEDGKHKNKDNITISADPKYSNY